MSRELTEEMDAVTRNRAMTDRYIFAKNATRSAILGSLQVVIDNVSHLDELVKSEHDEVSGVTDRLSELDGLLQGAEDLWADFLFRIDRARKELEERL